MAVNSRSESHQPRRRGPVVDGPGGLGGPRRGARWALRTLVVLGLALFAAVSAYGDAGAQSPGVLVTNHASALPNLSLVISADRAVRFTTGSHADGYLVEEIDALVRGTEGRAMPSLELYSSTEYGTDDGDRAHPNELLHSFAPPSTFGTGEQTFSAPGSGVWLASNTSYWVVLKTSGTETWSVAHTTELGPHADTGSASGWTIHGQTVRSGSGFSPIAVESGDTYAVPALAIRGSTFTPPRLTSVRFVSTPLDGDTYHAGENIEMLFLFSGTVRYVKGEAGLRMGSPGDDSYRGGTYISGSGSNALLYRYRVRSFDTDSDGVHLRTNPLGTTDQGNVVSAVTNNNANVTHAQVGPDDSHKVDGSESSCALVLCGDISVASIAEGAALGAAYWSADNATGGLSNRLFTTNSEHYAIDQLLVRQRQLELLLDREPTAKLLQSTTLQFGTGQFAFRDASLNGNRLTWRNINFTFSTGRQARFGIATDNTALTLTEAAVDVRGTTLTLQFSEPYAVPSDAAELQAFYTALAARFSLTAAGAAVTVTVDADNSDPSAGRLALSLGTAVTAGQAVVLTYTDPTTGDDSNVIEDAANNELATLTTGQGGVPGVVNSVASTLIANLDQGSGAALSTATSDGAFAQAFTTGPGGTDPTGYVLRSVQLGLAVASGAGVEVSLWSTSFKVDPSRTVSLPGGATYTPRAYEPHQRLVTLLAPPVIDNDVSTLETFVANSVYLYQNMTYLIVVRQTSGAAGDVRVATAATAGAADADSRTGVSLGARGWTGAVRGGAWTGVSSQAVLDASLRIGLGANQARVPQDGGAYVSNRGLQPQAAPVETGSGATRYATSFTPTNLVAGFGGASAVHGSYTGASSYQLDAVILDVAAEPGVTPRVSIHADSGGNPASSRLATTTSATSLATVFSRDLGAPTPVLASFGSGITLDRGTTYWVVVEVGSGSGGLSIGTTASDENDAYLSPDGWHPSIWDIGDGMQAYDGTSWSPVSGGRSFRMDVYGSTQIYGAVLRLRPAQVGLEATAVTYTRGQRRRDHSWQWQRGDSSDGTFTDIPAAEGGTAAGYVPVEADVGKWLKATLSYEDSFGEQTLSAVSPEPVFSRALVSNIETPLALDDISLSTAVTNKPLSFAQSMTTGREAAGYVLRGMRLHFSTDVHSPTVTWAIHADDGGLPAATPLFNPLEEQAPDLRGAAYGELSHPGVHLDPDTTYWFVTTARPDEGESATFSLRTITFFDVPLADYKLTPGSASGWRYPPVLLMSEEELTQRSWRAWSRDSSSALLRMSVVGFEGVGSTAPLLRSATVNGAGDQIELVFNEAFETPSDWAALAGRFTITAAGASVTPTAHSGFSSPSMGRLVLTLSPLIVAGQDVVLTYTDPTTGDDANVIEDSDGDETATFTTGVGGAPLLTNGARSDSTAPTLSAASVAASGTTIELEFSEALKAVAAGDLATVAGHFSVTVDSQPVAVTIPGGNRFDLAIVALNPAVTITSGQAVVVTYTDPSTGNDANVVEDVVGNDVATFITGQSGVVAVTNSSTVTADTTAPTLSSASVGADGTNIRLTFSEPFVVPTDSVELSLFQSVLPTRFRVTIDSVAVSGLHFSVSGGALVLASEGVVIESGQTVVVTYTDPTTGDDSNVIEDAAGNEAASFTTGRSGVVAVTNNSTVMTDTTAPRLTSASVDATGTTITLNFSEPFTEPPATNPLELINFIATVRTRFRVTVDSEPVQIELSTSSAAGRARLNLSGGVVIGAGQDVVVTYTDPTTGDDDNVIEDSDGNELATFTTGQGGVPAVTNNSAVILDRTAPTLSSASVDATGTSITLIFSEPYAGSTLTALASRFRVTVDGTRVTVTANSVRSARSSGRYVLTPATAIEGGQDVVVTYTDPTTGDDSNVIEDAAGNELATFTTGRGGVPAVTNNSLVGVEQLLVGNLSETGATTQTIGASGTDTLEAALRFTSGAHGGSYSLTSVTVDVATVGTDANPLVEIWTSTETGGTAVPGTRLYTLTDPSTFGAGAQVFTAPAGAVLQHSRSYWIVFKAEGGTTYSINETGSTASHASTDSASGWSIFGFIEKSSGSFTAVNVGTVGAHAHARAAVNGAALGGSSVWSAVMTAAEGGGTGPGYFNEQGHSFGSLTNSTFDHGQVSRTVLRLWRSNIGLTFKASSDFTNKNISELTLHVGGQSFALSAATENQDLVDGRVVLSWPLGGLTLTDGEVIAVGLTHVDLLPPELLSAEVSLSGSGVFLQFDEALAVRGALESAERARFFATLEDQFSLRVDGSVRRTLNISLSSVIQTGHLDLVFDSPIGGDSEVTLSYTQPSGEVALKDAAGRKTPSFTTGQGDAPAVVNRSEADLTVPTLEQAAVAADGESLTLTFSEGLLAENSPSFRADLAALFTVRADGAAAAHSVSASSAWTAGQVVLEFGVPLQRGQEVVVGYRDPTPNFNNHGDALLEDFSGNDVASFTTGRGGVPAVTNNSTVDTVAPRVTSVRVDSAGRIQLALSEPIATPTGAALTAYLTTLATQFDVLVDGSARQATAAEFSAAARLQLSFTPVIRSGQTVSLSYVDSSDGASRPDGAVAVGDAAGNELASFTAGTSGSALSVTNNSSVAPGAPGQPQNLVATANPPEIQLEWEAPVDDGGRPITGYRIEWTSDPSDPNSWTVLTSNTGDTATRYADTDVMALQDAAVTRHYRVSAVNARGAGTPSASDGATLPSLGVLSAGFAEIPRSHDGETAFTVRFRFSKPVTISAANFGRSSVTVTGGTINSGSARANREKTEYWFEITPTDMGDVTITLTGMRACTATGAICAADDEQLANTLTRTIEFAWPPTSTNQIVDVRRDAEYTFESTDFPYMQRQNAPLHRLTIETLPQSGRGTLRLSGQPLVAGAVVTAAELSSGALTYTPPAGLRGLAARLGYRVESVDARASSSNWLLLRIPQDAVSVSGEITALVGNLAPPRSLSTINLDRVVGAQSFRTGPNPHGYTVSGIELRLNLSYSPMSTDVGTYPWLEVRRDTALGEVVGRLQLPVAAPRNLAIYEYLPASPLHLAADSTYYLQVGGGSSAGWTRTDSDREDGTPAAGWSIGNTSLSRPQATQVYQLYTSPNVDALQLRVNGVVNSVTPAGQDLLRPSLERASVDGGRVTLRYSERLDPASVPAAADFSVFAGAEQVAVSAVRIDDAALTLTLERTILTSEFVLLLYSPGTNPIQDPAGNRARALNIQSVIHEAAERTLDRTAPVLSTASVEGAELTLTYDEPLSASTPAPGDYTVTAASASVRVATVQVSGATVTLGLAAAALEGQQVTVSYTPGGAPLADEVGNPAAALRAHSVKNETSGPPRLVSGTVNAATLMLTYHETLDTGSVPATSDFFAVRGSGQFMEVSAVRVSGSAVVLTLDSAVLRGDRVRLQYTPGTNPIRDADSEAAAALSLVNIRNLTGVETVPPVLSTATVNSESLVLTYNEALGGSTPAAGDFAVVVNGATATVASVTVSDRVVTLTLSPAATFGQTVTLSYTPGTNPIEDLSGNPAAALSNRSVVNQTPDTTPALAGAVVDGDELRLTYSRPLRTAPLPAAGDFGVRAAGAALAVRSVAIGGADATVVTLLLVQAVESGQAVTVSYTPGANPLRSREGEPAPALNNAAVTNVTDDVTPPALQSASAQGASLTLTYDEPLDPSSTPAPSAFAVVIDDAPVAVSAVAVGGSAATLTIAEPVAAGQTVTVSYTPGSNPLRDLASPPNRAAGLIEEAVTIATGPPVITGGGGGGGGGPTPSTVDFEWTVKHDIEELDRGHADPTGMWSDGKTLWLLQNGSGADDAVYAYDLESGERVEEREFELDGANRAPRGIWSDGETVWVSDSGQDRLFAYGLEAGERLEEREIELASRNRDARGIWSDGQAMWVLDGGKDSLFAYSLASGAFVAEYALHDANGDPHGIWSDGVAVWVSDHGAKRLFAYRLPALPAEGEATPEDPIDLERVSGEEFEEPGRVGNNSPRGIWSDGAVMYVADELDGRVYTYNMPDAIDARLGSLSLEGVDIGEFDPARTDYEGAVAEGVTATVVTAAAIQPRTEVLIGPPDADEAAEGHQVALDGVGEVTVTVTSQDGSRKRVYRVTLPTPADEGACLRGAIAEGFSLVVYEGGSVGDLAACAEERHVVALYVLDGGEWVLYIPGAPEFVNRPFAELFADGVPALLPLIVASDGLATPAPAVRAVTAPFAECLLGEIGEGFSLVVYEGGSVGELGTCAQSLGVTALYALAGGEWVSYILGAPALVNRPFAELFADGVPAATPLAVRGESP